MEPVIVAAVGAICSSLIIVVFKDGFFALFKRTSRDWSGLWKGTVYSYDTKTRYTVTVKLKQTGQTVTGTITSHEPEVLEYTIKGTVHEPEFMTYYAVNSNKNTLNYLVGINRFDRGANKLFGKYLARSRIVQRIGSGSIELELSK